MRDEQRMKELWDRFQAARNRVSESGATNPDDLSWGDSLINLAAAMILLHPANLIKRTGRDEVEQQMKAASTLFHLDTIEELVRLGEILNATEGFESKALVHPNEAVESIVDLPVDEADEINRRFRKIVGLDN